MTDERAMRFGYLLSEMEMGIKGIQAMTMDDVMLALSLIRRDLDEATEIMAAISREALDKTVVRLKDPLPEGTEVDEVLPE